MSKKLWIIFNVNNNTKGDAAINVKTQIDMADKLMDKRFVPFTPLMSHFQHMVHPRDYEDWIELDKIWIFDCDCILRLPCESSGADGEVELGNNLNIPIFYSIEELVTHYQS